jgi:hypothetical protein
MHTVVSLSPQWTSNAISFLGNEHESFAVSSDIADKIQPIIEAGGRRESA